MKQLGENDERVMVHSGIILLAWMFEESTLPLMRTRMTRTTATMRRKGKTGTGLDSRTGGSLQSGVSAILAGPDHSHAYN